MGHSKNNGWLYKVQRSQTCVTKFGKVSVFSDLSNLDDIPMRKDYIEICGKPKGSGAA